MADDDKEQAKPSFDPRKSAERWEKELTAAKKNLQKFHATARKVNKKYLDERDSAMSGVDSDGAYKLNLFWSNVEVLKASLYAKPPRVDVSNSFKDTDDDLSRVAANIIERMLNHNVERDDSDFDDAVKEAISDYLIVGLGQVWYAYTVETATETTEPVADAEGAEQVAGQEYEAITHEECTTEHVHWEDFWWSPCRTWKECRWVAKRVFMNRDELAKRFGDKIAKTVPLSKQKKQADSTRPDDPWEKAEVFEIWDKLSKRVYWHTMGMDVVLDEKDDPLKLTHFFPCPPPLMANLTTSNTIPRADYKFAQDQYDQIDELTTRLTYLIRACKAVGAYDKQATALGRIFTEGQENQLVPVDNWAAFAEKGGIQGSMQFVPIDVIAAVIEKLTVQRDVLKQNLFEVIGIGDIMRGMTNPDETLGAQQLKAQFGGNRLQYKQQQIGKWVSAGQRLHAEIICYHFQPQTIVERSNIMHSADAQMAPQAIQFLKQDATKKYRITVESETMAMVDWAQERDSRTQFMQAVGAFVQATTPLVQSSPQAAPVILQLMKWGLGGFRVSKEIETVLDQAIAAAQQPNPPVPDPEKDAKVEETKASAVQKRTAAVKNLADARKTHMEAAVAPFEAALSAPNEPPVPPGAAPLDGAPVPGAPMQQAPMQ